MENCDLILFTYTLHFLCIGGDGHTRCKAVENESIYLAFLSVVWKSKMILKNVWKVNENIYWKPLKEGAQAEGHILNMGVFNWWQSESLSDVNKKENKQMSHIMATSDCLLEIWTQASYILCLPLKIFSARIFCMLKYTSVQLEEASLKAPPLTTDALARKEASP